MTPERIAELREMETVFSVYAGFVIDNPTFRELLDEIERLRKELAEARRLLSKARGHVPHARVDYYATEKGCFETCLRCAIDAAKGEQG